MTKDKLEVGVSKDGLSLVSQGESAGRLGNALADALSPFTNSLGLVGDSIAGYRELQNFKRKNLLRTVIRASEIAEERGIERSLVDKKFLLSWVEGASKEEAEELSDLWAGLLANASEESVDLPPSYVSVLKNIGAKEAALMLEFATDTDHGVGLLYEEVRDAGIWSDGAVASLNSFLNENPNTADVVGRFEKIALQRSDRLLKLSSVRLGGLPKISAFFKRNHRDIVALEREGLIRIRRSSVSTNFGEFVVDECALTQFGFDFVWACRGHNTADAGLLYQTLREPK